MQIKLLSDLHFEFHRDGGKEFINSLDSEGDVCVLAGDIATKDLLDSVLSQFCQKYPRVILVPGNHEYYGSDRSTIEKTLRATANSNSNLTVLQRDVVEIDGLRFVGTTLWFPYNETAAQLKGWLTDFSAIRGFTDWIAKENTLNINFLKEIKEGDIVVTHHLPSYRSVHPSYAGTKTNCFFVCDVEELILENKPALWLHGHTHSSVDYQLGSTRVVCNPFGYSVHENFKFNPSLILTV